MKFILPLCLFWLAGAHALFGGPSSKPAAQPESPRPSAEPTPTLANVPYGAHERQVLDFWKAPASRPTPLVFYIHDGGWQKNDKSRVYGVARYLAAGISVVSINYRYVQQAQAAGIFPPVMVPSQDAARALQFVRSKAGEWNIDPTRIALSGNSAGGCTGLWLAFHADMADPSSADPVARQSTRALCVAAAAPQTTLDPYEMKQWTPNSRYGGHAFGFRWVPERPMAEFEAFYAQRDKLLPEIQKYSPMALVTADAPPVYMSFPNDQPAIGQNREDPTHTANFGLKLAEKLRSLGVECELVYPGAPNVKHATMQDYLIDKLQQAVP